MSGRILMAIVAFLLLPGVHGSRQVHAQGDANRLTDTLAQVGRRVITAADLVRRIDLMPWPGKDRPADMESLRVKALRSLVAEQLLAMEAANDGVGMDSAARMHVRNVQKLLVRDALYRSEVKSRVTVGEPEVREGLMRYAYRVKILMIASPSEQSARTLSHALSSGESVDSVLARRSEFPSTSVDTVAVTFGLLERNQEDAVYGLNPQVPASPPVRLPGLGWAVLYLLQKEPNPEFSNRTTEERNQSVREKIRLRKELALADRYSASLLAPYRAEAQPQAFRALGETLLGIFRAETRPRGEAYRLSDILDSAEAALAGRSADLLVKMEKGGMTFADLLESFRVVDVVFPTLEKADVMRRLNAAVREAVAREILSREGYRRHLEQSEDVVRDVGIWSDYWRAAALEERITRSVTVSDEEVNDSLVAQVRVRGDSDEVNVREVLCDSLQEAMGMLRRILGGEDMKRLAREHSKRREWAMRDGESGFFSIGAHPEIGVRAAELDSGAMAGPVKLPEGYSIFTLLGKRLDGGASEWSVERMRQALSSALAARKKQEELGRFLSDEARHFGVRMFYDRLKEVEIAGVNMVTKRLIGFGGSMMAAPPLRPLWEWSESAAGASRVNP